MREFPTTAHKYTTLKILVDDNDNKNITRQNANENSSKIAQRVERESSQEWNNKIN